MTAPITADDRPPSAAPEFFDLHSHAFNAGFLPIEGIVLVRTKRPKLAAIVYAIVNRLLETEVLKDAASVDDVALEAFYRALSRLDRDDDARDILAGGDFFKWFANAIPERELADIAPSVDDLTVQDVSDVVMLEVGVDRAEFAGAAGSVSVRARVELALREASRLAGDVETSAGDSLGARTSLGGIIEFLCRVVRHESRIVADFAPFWKNATFEGRLHHMMDMDRHYPGRPPRYDVSVRIDRMVAVVKDARPPLYGFVAFDPFRPNSLEIVDAALKRGFVGVKFYPPNGYRPIDNAPEDIAPPMTAAEVNDRNLALFRYCVERQVPLFTHCTSDGFESRPGETGRFSNPRHWRRVLEASGLGQLRLCFGHAGGQEGWFAGAGPNGNSEWVESFAYEALELCATYPNVFLDFGFFDRVLSQDQWSRFALRLRRALVRFPGFSQRCCYGSDWYLVGLKKDANRYAERFRTFLKKDPVLVQYADAILRTNARAFLRL